MSGEQLIGAIIGGLAGHLVAALIAGGGYRYIGGNWFEVVREPMSCLKGSLVEVLCVGLGAGAGYVLAPMLFG